jgi:hypothetical protein
MSTAFSVMPPDAIETVLKALGTGRAHLVTAEGERMDLGA